MRRQKLRRTCPGNGPRPRKGAALFFCKPADAIVANGSTIPFPPQTKDLQHEIELVVAIGKDGHDIEPSRALDHVYGYAVGIDLTRRDLQQEAKDKRRPWDWGKAFDNSAPCGAIKRVSDIGHPIFGRISIAVNGQLKQDSNIDQLIWPVKDVIAIISASMTLRAGDLIFTGTPSGVGPVSVGDVMLGQIAGVGSLEIEMGLPASGMKR